MAVGGGGGIIYVREDIPSREMKAHPAAINFEGIFFEINRKNPNGCYLVVITHTKIIFQII